MGLFNSIFGNKEKQVEKSHVKWIPFTSLDQIKEIQNQSEAETILIFKHSTRCGISNMVIKQFERMFDESMENIKVYYLDLLNYRELSNEVGYTFQVLHQSPQLLIIRNGVSVANASHYDITQIDIQKYL